jgi:hypothetical protein
MSAPPFDIKTLLSDLVETRLKEGSRVVTKEGVKTAVLVRIDEWKQAKAARPDAPESGQWPYLKDVLLDPNGSHDIRISPSGRYRRRTPIERED